MNYLGLDIGGTKIAAVVMDEQGRERGALPLRNTQRKPSGIYIVHRGFRCRYSRPDGIADGYWHRVAGQRFATAWRHS